MPPLLGPDGQPINTKLLRQELAAPEISGVRQVLPQHPSTGLTPTRLAGLLRGAESQDPKDYLALAEDMEEKEPQYLTVLGVRKRAVTQLDITVEPASDSAADAANAALIQDFLSRDMLADELIDVLDAIGKGFSVSEIIWDVSERQWMPRELKWLDPRWIEFDRVDLATPMLKTIEGPVPLAPYKFLPYFARAKSGIPIRGGVARAVAWCYLFKNYDIKGWVQFAEVYGQPLRLGKYHAGATEDERRTLLRAVAQIGSDAAAIIPQGMEMQFERGAETGADELFERLARYMDQQIAKIVLGQTTTTDAISGGHAVSQEHNDVRGDISQSDARQLAACLNRHLVRPIVDLNRGPQAAYPRIHIGMAEETDVTEFSSAVERLARAGVRISATEVRSRLGLRDPEADEEIIGAAPPPPMALAPAPEDGAPPVAPASLNQVHAHGAGFCAIHGVATPPRDIIDDLAVEALENDAWVEIMTPIIDPVRALVNDAGSFDELRSRLAGTIAAMDDTALVQMLERAGFTIRVAARIDADDDEQIV